LAQQDNDPAKRGHPRVSKPQPDQKEFPTINRGTQSPRLRPAPRQDATFSKAGILAFLLLIGLLLLSLTGMVISSLPQLHQATHRGLAPTATDDQDQDGTPAPPIYMPGNKAIPPLPLPKGGDIVYEQQGNLYMVPSIGGMARLLATPGYAYNEAVRPIVTPSGQLLYSGNGVWLMDIFAETATQIASLASDQVITSIALSSDGTMVAWSTEPIDGEGNVSIYAGPLTAPTLVYEQSAQDCPCFRIFAFMNGPGKQGDDMLLLSDDQASHEAVQYGLWFLNLTIPASEPQPLMDEGSLQGPLGASANGNTLLYAPDEGVVPNPTDDSVPVDIASLTYADSLDLATLGGNPLVLSTSQVVLPEQHDLNNNAAYHWVTTPLFTPDGHTLIYVEFSSDFQAPYDRHSAVYTIQITGSGKRLHASKPRLLLTSTSLLMELGVWLNDHVLTFYADGTLYALDIHSGAVTTVLQTGAYARIIAVVGNESA